MNSNIAQLIVLLLLVCGAQSQRLNLDDTKNISIKSLSSYNRWRNQHKRNYLNDDQQLFRQLIFLENLKKIEEHNSNPENTFTVSVNQFSDMTDEEFGSRILTNNVEDEEFDHLEEDSSVSFAGTTTTVAASIDWRAKGAVTAIKDQGKCGSCWTFATTGIMEGFNFIKNGKLQTFSEQQIVDCAIAANGVAGFGCDGGSALKGLTYAQKYGALESSAYPYVALQGKCKVTAPTTGFKPKTFVRLASTSDALKVALNKGPVAVSVDASSWRSYSSGVYNGCSSIPSLNHAVLAVGYDTQGNWIVKNSWNASWGEKGYIRLATGDTCGILKINYALTA